MKSVSGLALFSPNEKELFLYQLKTQTWFKWSECGAYRLGNGGKCRDQKKIVTL